MKWVKRLGIVVAVILVLLVAVIAYVMFFVNSSSFKTELQKVAFEKAGVHLRIDGGIHWSFFPWLGLEMDKIGVSIGQDPEIVQFDRAEFGLAILPLLKHTIQVDRVRLVDLKANLKVDKAGHGNWSLPSPATSTAAVVGKAPASQSNASHFSSAYQASSNGSGSKTIPNIRLDSLEIKNAQVTYTDASTNQHLDTTLNINLSNVEWNKSWPMVIDAVIKKSDLQGSHALTVSGKLTSDLTVFPEREALSLSNIALSAQLQGKELPRSPLQTDVKIRQMDVDIPQENIFMDGIFAKALGVNANATLKLYQAFSSPQYMASLSMDNFSPKQLLKQLNVTLPNMADNSVMEKASVDMKVEGGLSQLLVQSLVVELDDTVLNANIAAEFSPFRWDANLSGEDLNLDRYLPPVTESSNAKKVAVANSSNSKETTVSSDENEPLLPLDLIRSLNGHLGVRFKNVTVKKLQLDSLSLDATMAHGLIKVSPAVVNLYQGQANLKAKYDARGAKPRLDVSTRVNDIEIQPLLEDFIDMTKLSGTTTLAGELSAQGNQAKTLMSSLNGDIVAEINNGSLVGTNLTKVVCQGISAIRKESLDGANFGADTPFDTMDFPIHIVNGVVSTPGLTMSSAGVSVSGDGVVSLPMKSLDYQINVALAGSELDHACRVNDKVTNLAFPVICKGNFSDDPAGMCRPDLVGFGRIFADLAKKELQSKVAEEKAKLQAKTEAEAAAAKEKLKEKLKDKLKSLF